MSEDNDGVHLPKEPQRNRHGPSYRWHFYIRQLILQNGYKLPANDHDFMKYVQDDYNEARIKMVEIITGELESE